MRRIFEEENRLQIMLDVEASLAWAQSEVGEIPKSDAKNIVRSASIQYVKLDRVKAIEHEIKHDVMAIVRALAEASGSSGAYVHLGATSADINDTATALQLAEATNILKNRLDNLEKTLLAKHKSTDRRS
jgi:adenylosuccinate lyase